MSMSLELDKYPTCRKSEIYSNQNHKIHPIIKDISGFKWHREETKEKEQVIYSECQK